MGGGGEGESEGAEGVVLGEGVVVGSLKGV